MIPLCSEGVRECCACLDFNEMSEIDGVLQGMKGQYLILNIGVVNIRKFSGYQITMIL